MKTVAIALFVFLAAVPRTFAQQYTQVSGLITDGSEAGVPGAQVTVVSEDTGFRRVTRSQGNGAYAVGALQPGLYRIMVHKEGFRTMIRVGVKLDVAVQSRVDFSLIVGSVTDSITVEGTPIAMNTEDASVGTLIGRDWIERLPITGRGILGLLELSPGTVITPATRGEAGQFTVNGQRPNTHYFTVDGLSVNTGVSGGGQPALSTGGTLPGLTAFGSFHHVASVETLDEFRMQTSTFVPEFGRLPGAQVSVSSRSGGNDLHGSVFAFLRNEKLEANDWFANQLGLEKAPTRLQHLGAVLGGPIQRNRAFFFASYENMRLRQPLVWRTLVPSLATRTQAPEWAGPLMDLYPLPTGPDLSAGLAEWAGNGNRPSRMQSRSLRLDYAITSRVTAFARYLDTPSRTEFGNLQINHLGVRSRAVSAGLNAVFGGGVIEDLRAGWTDSRGNSEWRLARENALPDCYLPSIAWQVNRVRVPCDAFMQFSISGLGQILRGNESTSRQTQWNAVETLAVNRSRHQFRFGVDYRRIAPYLARPHNYVNVLADSIGDLLDSDNVWIISTPPEPKRIWLRELSVFAQDNWHLTPRVTVTYGMRWELNPPPSSSKWVPGLDSSGSGTFSRPEPREIWKLRYTNLAPRIGVAWRLRENGDTVLRSGFGLYYDSSVGAATDLLTDNKSYQWEPAPGSSSTGTVKTFLSFGFAPDLRLPVTRQWNVTLEHSVTRGQTVSLGYVGSVGNDLLRREIGGAAVASAFRELITTNQASSNYHGLQLQYQRRMANRLQATASYTWSHSVDNSSTDAALYWVGGDYARSLDRGSSDFDVRHAVSAAFTFDMGAGRQGSRWARVYGGWSLDGILRARTGFPVSVLGAEYALGLPFANVFRPDVVPGAEVWLSDPNAPGGRRLNPDAFQTRSTLTQGVLGRNAITGFGMAQADLALRREFALGERLHLEFRTEVFNVTNRANLADPVRFLASPLFGEPASMLNSMLSTGTPASGLAPMLQIGGPRSLQLSLRMKF